MRTTIKEEYTIEHIFYTLDEIYKQGYCDIASLPQFLKNEYRDLSNLKIVEYVNGWIDSRKINHKHLVIKERK